MTEAEIYEAGVDENGNWPDPKVARIAALEAALATAQEQARMASFMGEGYALVEARAVAAEAEVARLTAGTVMLVTDRDEYKALAVSLRARIAALAAALQAHHDWHLAQDRDGNAWGIDPVDAYSESDLCEQTIAALEAKP